MVRLLALARSKLKQTTKTSCYLLGQGRFCSPWPSSPPFGLLHFLLRVVCFQAFCFAKSSYCLPCSCPPITSRLLRSAAGCRLQSERSSTQTVLKRGLVKLLGSFLILHRDNMHGICITKDCKSLGKRFDNHRHGHNSHKLSMLRDQFPLF